MNFHIGDPVIHMTYGAGRITAIDEKSLAGKTRQYYAVDTGQLTLWVTTDQNGEKSIRPPTGSAEFRELLETLTGPGESMPEHHIERKSELNERMQDRALENICCVIRDLNTLSTHHDLNQNDLAVLRRAKEYLLDEWELSLGTPRSKAMRELGVLLRESPTMETEAGG